MTVSMAGRPYSEWKDEDLLREKQLLEEGVMRNGLAALSAPNEPGATLDDVTRLAVRFASFQEPLDKLNEALRGRGLMP